MLALSVVLLVVVLAAAAGLFLTVAVSSGHLRLPEGRLSRAVASMNRHLNGTGQVPQFLRHLDQR